ncbi:hypothetical protein [Aureivirga sp. CE67]|uniref:hypothetical protein n=1 Tax=Aureivirga sp. CE67 TaxID=1788983 RepID=UPI0018C9CB82|nr:hypothetical protein [Aureivirga sp. CE67]
MRSLLILGVVLFSVFKINAQENYKSLTEVDTQPILSVCNSEETKEESSTCLQKTFPKLLSEKIKISVFNEQNLPKGSHEILVSFTISEDAKITNIVVDFDNVEIKNEIIRALNKIDFKAPGMVDGKPVGVKYSFPMNFTVA